MPRSLLMVLIAALATALGAGPAAADTFCVAPATGCPADHTFAATATGVQQALDAAGAAAGRDTVRLGAATYVAAPGFTGWSYVHADPVDVVGEGRGAGGTVLDQEAGPSQTVLRLLTTGASGRSSVSGLAIALRANPSSGVDAGLDLIGAIDVSGVGVTGAPGARAFGMTIQGDATVAGSAVDLPAGTNHALSVDGPATITDTTLRGGDGLYVNSASVVHAHRLRIDATGGNAVEAWGATTTLDDAAIALHGGAHGVLAATGTDGDVTFVGKHLTIAGDGSGVTALANGSGRTATVVVSESVVQTTDTPLARTVAAGTANLTASWNDYGVSPPPDMDAPEGTGSLSDTHRLTVDPAFADAAAGDFRPRFGSPLIDAGDPGDATITGFESATDARGKSRIVGGARDIGAYEYQHVAPEVSAAGGGEGIVAGAEASYDAWTADVDGDPLTYRWAFDDGTVLTGPVVGDHGIARHAFATAGRHTADVTIEDGTGLSATTHLVTEIGAAPAPPAPPGPDAPGAPGGGSGNTTNNTPRPPASVPAPRFSGVTLGPRRARLSATGRVALTATCPPTAQTRCAGTVRLVARLTRRGRSRTLGAAAFAASPGRSASVRIRLSAAARSALGHRSLAVTATAVAHDARGVAVTSTRHVTLVAARRARAAAARLSTRAGAVQISDVTNNESAQIAIADDGTGLFAWASGTNPVTISVCRVLPGGQTCQDRHDLPLNGYRNLRTSSLAIGAFGAQVVVSATGEGQTAIAGPSGDATAVWTSGDRGATFTSTNLAQGNEPTGTGILAPYLEPLRTLVLPNATLTVNVRRNGAMRGVWLQQSINGPGTTTSKVKLFDAAPWDAGGNVDAYVGWDPTGGRVVVVRQTDGSLHWRSYGGPDSGVATASNWTADDVVADPGGNYPELLTAGAGTTAPAWLAYLRDDVFGADAIRMFTGFGWQDPGESPRPRDSIFPTYAVSPHGTLAAVYSPRDHEGDVRLSTDGGATWSAPARFTCEAGILPRVAIDDSGDGWVRWIADDVTIRAARITDRPGPCPGDGDTTNNPPPATGDGTGSPPAPGATPAPTPRPTPTLAGSLRLTLRAPARATLDRTHHLALTATCTGATGRCKGSLYATAMLTRRSHGRTRRASVTIAHGNLSLTPGRPGTIRLRLTTRAAAAVRAAGHAGLRVTVQAFIGDTADGNRTGSTTRRLRVVAAARSRARGSATW